MQATTVYLGLGANLGNRAAAIHAAVDRLRDGTLLDVVCSQIYETAAVADEPQPDYLNAVVRGRTMLDPVALLRRCLAIETELGRVRPAGRRFAPRTIDIDVLLHGDAIRATPELTLPHPRMLERSFVRVPLAEVAEPGLRHPTSGESLTTPGRAFRPPRR